MKKPSSTGIDYNAAKLLYKYDSRVGGAPSECIHRQCITCDL